MSENEWPALPEHLRVFESATTDDSNRLLVMDYLRVPDDVRALLRLYDAVIIPKDGRLRVAPDHSGHEADCSQWHLHLPTRMDKPVVMPLPVAIENEEHWKAIIAAAADLQGMVNRGEYKPA